MKPKYKQVNEIFDALCNNAYKKSICYSLPAYKEIAETIYNAGYRKADELANDLINEFNKFYEPLLKNVEIAGTYIIMRTFIKEFFIKNDIKIE